jgi:hypothetical protein
VLALGERGLLGGLPACEQLGLQLLLLCALEPQLLLLQLDELRRNAAGRGLCREQQRPELIHEGRGLGLEEAGQIDLHRLGIHEPVRRARARATASLRELRHDKLNKNVVVDPRNLNDAPVDPGLDHGELDLGDVDALVEVRREAHALQVPPALVAESRVLVDRRPAEERHGAHAPPF